MFFTQFIGNCDCTKTRFFEWLNSIFTIKKKFETLKLLVWKRQYSLELTLDKEVMLRNIYIAFVISAAVVESSALSANRSRRSGDTCGVSKSESGLIVRGKNFPRGTFPWIVALLHTRTKPPQFFCGGTLISKIFVVSGEYFDSNFFRLTSIIYCF